VGYWMWLVKGLTHKRYRAFLRLIPVLDERLKIAKQLSELINQQIKAEKALCMKITSLCDKISPERQKVRRRLVLEAQLTKYLAQLVKAIQHYTSVRTNSKIMQVQIALAEIEERIASDMLLFNTLTERYNNEVEITVMRPFAALLKLRRQKEYYVLEEE
jgi:hypothetical protein